MARGDVVKNWTSWPPIRLGLALAQLYRRCGFSRSAAALAYFLVLTLFPLLLCVNYFIGLFYPDLAYLLQPLRQFLPADVLRLLDDYLVYASASRSLPLFFAALLTILFSASAGLRTVFHTMDQLFDHTPSRPVLRFLFSPVLALFFLVVIYLSIAVLITGDWFFLFLETHLPAAVGQYLPLPTLGLLWQWIRYVVLFCSMLVLVLALYRVGIPRQVGGRRIFSATLVTTFSLLICAAISSILIGASSRYTLVYGSLAGLIILLVWLYTCGLILLLGAALCRIFPLKKP